jgi:SM-20-related protein
MQEIPLFELNPSLNRERLAEDFARNGRIQIRDFLTKAAAKTIHSLLAGGTPWGLAWQAADDGPHGVKQQKLAGMSAEERTLIGSKLDRAIRGNEYGFLYAQYPFLDAYLEKWAPGGPHDLLFEHINADPFLSFIREVTGIDELIKADAQGTLYAPGHFLAIHDDSHKAEGWRVAYVMSFCAEDWRPEWGGYLQFYDEDGDVVAGLKPRFNALNLFKVPQRHAVTFVPPFAPVGRFAITGWFRDR